MTRIASMIGMFLVLVPAAFANEPSHLARIQVELGNMSMDNGTGSLISSEHILTCWHNLRGHRVGNLYVVLRDGSRVKATVLKKSQLPDLALLKLEKPTLLSPIQLADVEPQAGDSVTIYGYPLAQDLEVISTTVREERFSATPFGDPIFFRVNDRATAGMSGGPVVNEDCEQCGVLFGSVANGYITGIEAILRFLEDTEFTTNEGLLE